MHGHKDKEKDQLVHDSSTSFQFSKRILLSLAVMYGFKLWKTAKEFESKPREYDKIRFSGFYIEKSEKDAFIHEEACQTSFRN